VAPSSEMEKVTETGATGRVSVLMVETIREGLVSHLVPSHKDVGDNTAIVLEGLYLLIVVASFITNWGMSPIAVGRPLVLMNPIPTHVVLHGIPHRISKGIGKESPDYPGGYPDNQGHDSESAQYYGSGHLRRGRIMGSIWHEILRCDYCATIRPAGFSTHIW